MNQNLASQEIKQKTQGVGRSDLGLWWQRHQKTVLRLAIGVMGVLAVLKLGDEFRRLLWDTTRAGAFDLRDYHMLVHGWFSEIDVLRVYDVAIYPPATYLILWPLIGWLDLDPARVFWAVTTVVVMAWLALCVVRASGAQKPLERTFVILLLLSMNAAGVAIGNGQLILHILPCVVAALLLARANPSWVRDLVIAGLFLFSLVKPTISAPFFWILLFTSNRSLRAVVLVIIGYVATTMVAVSFQEGSLLAVIKMLFFGGLHHTAIVGGYANVHNWLAAFGLQEYKMYASLFLFVGSGLWIFSNRRVNIWLLIGVTALIARFWTYHRVYDDVLILLPMIVLFRIACHPSHKGQRNYAAGILLAVTVFVMLWPAQLLVLPDPWGLVFRSSHAVVWLVVLGFLLREVFIQNTTLIEAKDLNYQVAVHAS